MTQLNFLYRGPLILMMILVLHHSVAQEARIKIDPDRVIGDISPLIYGNFVEHLGRCVYGGIYEPGSPLADEDGFRKDVMEAVRDLNISIIRYPGGNFVSNYHWLDGVGAERTARMELAWNRLETNEFGTNEFIKFAHKVGAEPFFAVNMGTGTMVEARRWVEYTNVESGPYYAELRKEHGYPDPYKIKYWSLGNEMDGGWQMGHLNSEDYTKKARETAKLMKMTDRDIKIIGSGSSNYGSDADPNHWNQTVVDVLHEYIDYLALHLYLGNPDSDYYGFMSTPMVMEERTDIARGLIQRTIEETGREQPIYIAWDEWNVWYRATGAAATQGDRALEEHYNLEDALVVAGMLNVFVRNADIVKMANMAQLVNVIAPIFTNETGLFKQTIYYPFQMFSKNMKGKSLDVFLEVDTYETGQFRKNAWDQPDSQQDVPYLDVTAALDEDQIVIAVINRHQDESIRTSILCQECSFEGDLEILELTGPDIKSTNTFGKEVVQTRERSPLPASGNLVEYSFPPHSLILLRGKISPNQR